MLVNQRGGQFDLERLFFQQIDGRGRGDWQVAHQLGRNLPHRRAGFRFRTIGIGILHQRRRHPDFAQQLLLRARSQFGETARICSTSSFNDS